MLANLKEFHLHLNTIPDKREKMLAQFRFCRNYIEMDIPGTMKLVEEACLTAKELNDAAGLGFYDFYTAFKFWTLNDFEKAQQHFKNAVRLFQSSEFKEGLGLVHSFGAYILWDQGEYDKAFENGYLAMKYSEEAGSGEGIAWSHHALGVFFQNLHDFPAAMRHFEAGLSRFEELNYGYGQARIRSAIATILLDENKFDEALVHIDFSRGVYKKLSQKTGEGRTLNDLGVIYRKKGEIERAEQLLKDSLELRQSIQHNQGIITTHIELGELYLQTGNYAFSLSHLEKARIIAETMKVKPKLFRIHKLISEVYKKMNDPWKAIEHSEKFFEIRSEVTGEQASNKLKNLQTQYATEKSEKEAEIHRLRNVELKQAYEEIEEKNKNILDSIQYASRIQHAILPGENEFISHFRDAFVLYLPRDVVSGDFYWIAEKNGILMFSVADCTGHGVPGALMSMIGSALLNQAVNEKQLSDPAEILGEVRNGIIQALKQNEGTSSQKDGMDAVLCKLDVKSRLMGFAGAQNPAWIIRGMDVLELIPDKQPIGIHFGELKPFTGREEKLKEGDCVYLFTDGYADQFGGPNGKKFKYRQLKELLFKIHSLPMQEQKAVLLQTFNEWKGNLEQVDDVLVAGFRV